MDHSAVGQLIVSRMRERRQNLASSVQPPIEAPFQLAYQKLQANLCGDESAFDFTGPSLQNRLLDYLEKEFKSTDGICMLQAAERSRQLLRDSVWKAVATGLHAGNKELWPLVTGFSDFELFVLEQIVTDSNPAKRLAQPEAIAIVLRKLAHSDGVNLVTYLAKRLELQNSRRPTARGSRRTQIVNHADLLFVRMWTDPNCPLWLAPSAGIANLIHKVTSQRVENATVNTLVKKRGLTRMPDKILRRLFSKSLGDPVGRELREELAVACEFEVEKVRRGRRGTA